jgi:hypothetical protein
MPYFALQDYTCCEENIGNLTRSTIDNNAKAAFIIQIYGSFLIFQNFIPSITFCHGMHLHTYFQFNSRSAFSVAAYTISASPGRRAAITRGIFWHKKKELSGEIRTGKFFLRTWFELFPVSSIQSEIQYLLKINLTQGGAN